MLGEIARAQDLMLQAEALRERFTRVFWCAELATYAQALDGQKRPCRIRSSNAGHCLMEKIRRHTNLPRSSDTGNSSRPMKAYLTRHHIRLTQYFAARMSGVLLGRVFYNRGARIIRLTPLKAKRARPMPTPFGSPGMHAPGRRLTARWSIPSRRAGGISSSARRQADTSANMTRRN
jgi:hypothetical protein